jgi:1-pyrroline-5-carboxylate dehydrogenase
METADAASLPPGVLNLIKGEEAGPLLVDAEGVDSIAITGSHQAGMRIFRKMASSPMHGHSLRLRAFGRGMLGLLGRLCRRTRGRRILKRLKARAEAIAIGNPEERQTFMGPVINAAAVERFHKAVKAARSKGRIVHGGKALADTHYGTGHFVAPTIVAELSRDHWINKEQLFLPLLSVLGCASLVEGIAWGYRNVYGLCAGLYAENPQEIFARAEAGVLYVNRRTGATTGAGRPELLRLEGIGWGTRAIHHSSLHA